LPARSSKMLCEPMDRITITAPRPVGPLGAAAAQVSEVAGLPVGFLLAAGRFVGVMHEHATATNGVNYRVQLVAQKTANVFL